MKSKFFFFGLLACISAPAFSQTQTPPDKPLQPSQPIPKHPTNPTERPKAPSRSYIYFSYDKEEGKCLFTMPSETEWMSVSMENLATHFIYTGDVTSSYPVIDQAVDAGTYHVTCTTDDGDLYSGEVFVD